MNLFLQRMWIQVSADRRKFSALCGMVMLGLLLWARIIVISNLPRTAVADDTTVIESADPVAIEDSDRRQERVIVDLALRPGRDPFVISRFGASVTPKAAEPDKSPQDQSEDREQVVRQRRASLWALASQLRLDAILSDPPIAVLEGRTVQVGEVIAVEGHEEIKFVLSAVKERSAVIQCEGHTFELTIPAPKGQ